MSTTTTTTELETFQPHHNCKAGPSIRQTHLGRSSLESSRSGLATNATQSANTPNGASSLSSDASTRKGTSRLQASIIIFQPALVNFLCSFTNGVIVVGLPAIARSIDLPRALYLWPSSVYGLTAGSMLLIAGSIADLIGARLVELVGIFLMGVFTLACGFSDTGVQLVVFRALQGIATAMHLPASVALVANALPQGRARNIGFACLGFSQPLGFSVGLVASGAMIENIGWRSGFFLSGGATLVAAISAIWALPKIETDRHDETWLQLLRKVWTDIDWVGGTIASAGLAILAYVLAILSADLSTIRTPATAALLVLSVVLLIAFPFWMQYRVRVNKPALVPNALWRNIPFASTCVMIVMSYGVINSMELFCSLFFQEIQNYSVIATSLYLLPSLIVGVILNISVGLFIDKLPVRWIVAASAFLCAIAPLLMAVVNTEWSYWYAEFWAQIFAPFSVDVLFTVGLIIVSENFPEKTQALAGAVFNTVSQFGMSLGIGLCQFVALGVTGTESGGGHGGTEGEAFDNVSKADTLKGYRASFWTMFALMMASGFLAVIGLRKVGKVGVKRD